MKTAIKFLTVFFLVLTSLLQFFQTILFFYNSNYVWEADFIYQLMPLAFGLIFSLSMLLLAIYIFLDHLHSNKNN